MQSINFTDPKFQEITPFAQIIPAEMLQEIKKSAQTKGISVDDEVTTRLLATFIKPEEFGINARLTQLMHRKASSNQAKTESEHRRRAWLYIYEIDKLRILLSLEKYLPKNFKEKFSLIDVEKESIRIRAELNADEDENKNK